MANASGEKPLRDDWRVEAGLPLPRRHDYPIAIVGAGGIVMLLGSMM